MKDEDIIDTADKWREQDREARTERWFGVLQVITVLSLTAMLLGFTAWAVPSCSARRQTKKAAEAEDERAFVERREAERKRREIAWVECVEALGLETCQVVERRGQVLVFQAKDGWGFTETVNDGDAP